MLVCKKCSTGKELGWTTIGNDLTAPFNQWFVNRSYENGSTAPDGTRLYTINGRPCWPLDANHSLRLQGGTVWRMASALVMMCASNEQQMCRRANLSSIMVQYSRLLATRLLEFFIETLVNLGTRNI